MSSTTPTVYIINRLTRKAPVHKPILKGKSSVTHLNTYNDIRKAINMQGKKAKPPRRGMAFL